MIKKIGFLITATSLFLAGFITHGLTDREPGISENGSSSSYPLLARRLFIDEPSNFKVNFNPLRSIVSSYMKNNNLTGSVYFEYLPTGTSIRVDGDQQEVAASLLKVPAAMELYRASELGLVSLDQTIELKEEWLNDAFGTLYKKGAGHRLTLRDAAKIMLIDSDNTALIAIASTIEGKLPTDQSPFAYLDVDYTQNEDLSVSISARGYSSLLKCLYFSCYLSNEHSQELLDYLTQSSFDDRLKAGVSDRNMKVAHKIGNFADTTQSDCGIVYIEKSNYVICVMIDGPDDPTTAQHIAAVSRLAYDYVVANND